MAKKELKNVERVSKPTTLKKAVFGEIMEYVLTAVFTLLLATCVFCINKVPSGSMEPTIKTGTYIISWRLPFLTGDPTPKHGDIVVFRSTEGEKRLLIKRVIGLPGDSISIDNGYVYRNGEKLNEEYVKQEGTTEAPIETYVVPEGSVFVLGDNRMHSGDSRFLSNPYIPIHNLYAKFLVDLQFFAHRF